MSMDEVFLDLLFTYEHLLDTEKDLPKSFESQRSIICDWLEDNDFPNTASWIRDWNIEKEKHGTYFVYSSKNRRYHYEGGFETEEEAVSFIRSKVCDLLHKVIDLGYFERKSDG